MPLALTSIAPSPRMATISMPSSSAMILVTIVDGVDELEDLTGGPVVQLQQPSERNVRDAAMEALL